MTFQRTTLQKLLACMPRAYQHRFADEVLLVFEEEYTRIRQEEGPLRASWYWAQTVLDVTNGLRVEHTEEVLTMMHKKQLDLKYCFKMTLLGALLVGGGSSAVVFGDLIPETIHSYANRTDIDFLPATDPQVQALQRAVPDVKIFVEKTVVYQDWRPGPVQYGVVFRFAGKPDLSNVKTRYPGEAEITQALQKMRFPKPSKPGASKAEWMQDLNKPPAFLSQADAATFDRVYQAAEKHFADQAGAFEVSAHHQVGPEVYLERQQQTQMLCPYVYRRKGEDLNHGMGRVVALDQGYTCGFWIKWKWSEQ